MDVLTGLVARSQALLFVAEALAIALVAKKVDDWRTSSFDDDQLIVGQGNVALGIRRAGLLLGGTIAMAGVLAGTSQDLAADAAAVLLFGSAAYAALFLARWLSHTVMLRGISDDGECAKGNVAVGTMQCGIFVATGILLNGALSGEGTGLWQGLHAFALFFVLGQAVFLALAFVCQRLTPFDDRQELLRDNRAVAVEMAGLLVGLAIVLRAALLGPSQGFYSDSVGFLENACVGAVVLVIFQRVVRGLFLRGVTPARDLRDGNLAVALVLQALTIAFALLLA